MSEMPNPYEVLGVERTADARAIKRAYFAKVREFPPETHPEEFQRLRAAYELLSDEEARRQYDESQSEDSGPRLDPETSARLEQAMSLHNGGNGPQARDVLEKLLHEQPELHVARDMLGMFLLREGYAEAALARFEQLVREKPEEALYHLHQGFALSNLERYSDAVDAYRRAKALDPREVRIRTSLAECLTDWGLLHEALQEMDEAIAQVKVGAAPGDMRDLDLRLQRVELHLRAKVPWERTAAEVERLVATLPQTADAEMKRLLATRLGALAAGLFANHRTDEANRLLLRCRQLHPDSTVEVPYPHHVTLDVEALPKASQEWLANQSTSTGTGRWFWPVAYHAAMLLVACSLLVWAFLSRTERGAGDFAWVGLWLLLAGLGLVFTARDVLKAVANRLGRFVTLHSLYVLDVRSTRVTAYPLFNLRDIELTNHRTNYVYTHTSVRITFSQGAVVVNFNGEDVAKTWAQSVVSQRRRVLELLSRGLLEAEEGLDFIPAPMLLPRSEPLVARLKKRVGAVPWRPYAFAAGAAAVLWLLAIPVNLRRVDTKHWGEAVASNTAASARHYLFLHPKGHYAEQARALQDSRYAEALSHLAERVESERPGAKALKDVVEALAASGSTQVRYEVRSTLSSPEAWPVLGVEPQWVENALPERRQVLDAAVQHVLERSLSRELPLLFTGSGPQAPEGEPLPVTLSVSDDIRLANAFYPAPRGGARWPALEVHWTLELRFEGEPQPRHRFTVTTLSPAELPFGTGASASWAYALMAQQATEDFLDAWVEAWGLPGALDSSRRAATAVSSRAVSPYP